MLLQQELIETPTGDMELLTDEKGVVLALEWTDLKERRDCLLSRQHNGVGIEIEPRSAKSDAYARLADYFDGDLGAIDAIEVRHGGTDFQREVWAGLRTIPAGGTLNYGMLAERIGRKAAVRAVGLANGANPIGIITPCHRVIGKDGTLTGYGGGLDRKRWLLTHEGALTPQMV